MKNEENFEENLVAPAPKLLGNEIVRCRNGLQQNWCRRNCSTEKSCSCHIHHFERKDCFCSMHWNLHIICFSVLRVTGLNLPSFKILIMHT